MTGATINLSPSSFTRDSSSEYSSHLLSNELIVEIENTGSLNAIGFWYKICLNESNNCNDDTTRIEIDTIDDSNHYCQAVYLLDEPVLVQKNDTILISVSLDENAGVMCKLLKHEVHFNSSISSYI